jgi:hypothetical protein
MRRIYLVYFATFIDVIPNDPYWEVLIKLLGSYFVNFISL